MVEHFESQSPSRVLTCYLDIYVVHERSRYTRPRYRYPPEHTPVAFLGVYCRNSCMNQILLLVLLLTHVLEDLSLMLVVANLISYFLGHCYAATPVC